MSLDGPASQAIHRAHWTDTVPRRTAAYSKHVPVWPEMQALPLAPVVPAAIAESTEKERHSESRLLF